MIRIFLGMVSVALSFAASAQAEVPYYFRSGHFFLMSAPQQVRTRCDHGRELRLYMNDDGLVLADTQDAVDGECPILPDALRRTYLLKTTIDTCGIIHIDGQSYSDSGVSTLHVEDHRADDCGGEYPAQVVVTETFPRSHARTWFSQDPR